LQHAVAVSSWSTQP